METNKNNSKKYLILAVGVILLLGQLAAIVVIFSVSRWSLV